MLASLLVGDDSTTCPVSTAQSLSSPFLLPPCRAHKPAAGMLWYVLLATAGGLRLVDWSMHVFA